MSRNQSFGLVGVLAILMLVTLIFGTAVATPPAALTGNRASDPIYAANLIDWFLQHGGAGYRDDASSNAGYSAHLIDWFLQHGGSGYRDDASNDSSYAVNLIEWFLQHGGSGHRDDESNITTN